MRDYAITFLHTNDTHSYLDNFAKRAHLVRKLRQKHADNGVESFLIDAGDVLSGHIYFTMYQGMKEAELMNALGYDIMMLGNHEFDCGSHTLAQYISQLKAPIIVSNVDFSADAHLGPLAATQKEQQHIFPHLIKTLKNGLKIGFFGLLTDTTVESAAPSPETYFHAPTHKAKEMVEYFHKQGVTTIILLSHLGFDEDIKLAKSIKGLSLIIGAHTHTLIETPLIISNEDHTTYIVQAGKHGEHLGETTLSFNNNNEITSVSGKVHPIDQHLIEDANIQKIITQMQTDRDILATAPICTLHTELNGDRTALQKGSTNLGNLIADAFFHQALQNGAQPDLAIMNGGGIRTSLFAGTVTKEHIINVLPFLKTLVVLTVTGKQMKEALTSGLFPQVSQLKVTFQCHLNEENRKTIKELLIFQNKKWVPVSDTKSYRVATNSFVGYGKDNFIPLTHGTRLFENNKTDISLLIEYLQSLPQPISYADEPRVLYIK